MSSEPEFRFAERADVPLILCFIRELADYEGMLDEVVADEPTLEEWLFERRGAEVIFALEEGSEVGFALFFHNFSTFLGRSGLYLEDLYVAPEHRGKGYGKALLRELARIAVERGCGRLSLELAGYRPCHSADEVSAAAAYDPEADLPNTPDSVFCSHGAGHTVKWQDVPEHAHTTVDPARLRPYRAADAAFFSAVQK